MIDFANVKQLVYKGTEVYEATRKSNGAYLWTKPLGKLTITGSVLIGGSYSITRTNKLSPYSTTGSINSGATVYYGDTIKLTAVPHEGYKVVGEGVKETTFTIKNNEIPNYCYMNQDFEFARDSITAPIVTSIRYVDHDSQISFIFNVENDNLEDVSMSWYVYDGDGVQVVGFDDERTIPRKEVALNVQTMISSDVFPWHGTLKVIFEIEGGATGETSEAFDFRTQLEQATISYAIEGGKKVVVVQNPNDMTVYADLYYLNGQTWETIALRRMVAANHGSSIEIPSTLSGNVYFTVNLKVNYPNYKPSQFVTVLNVG